MEKRVISEKWRQVLPIPEGCVILVPGEDDEGKTAYLDLRKEGWSYFCLVHVELEYQDGGRENDIALYTADGSGYRDLEYDFKIVYGEEGGNGEGHGS